MNKQTVLHKAAMSIKKRFVTLWLVSGELDLFAEDRYGKKPEETTPEIKKLIVDMKQARGLS